MAFFIKHVRNILSWTVLLARAVLVHGTHCGLSEVEFFSVENQALQCCTYREITARSYVICGSYCHADSHCKSINYYRHSRRCQLNNATWFQHPDFFILMAGSAYFDGDRGKPQLSIPPTSQPSLLPTTSGTLVTSTSGNSMSPMTHDTELSTPHDSSVPSTPGHSVIPSTPQLSVPSIAPLYSAQPAAEFDSCAAAQAAGQTSGIFTIFPPGFSEGLRVYCDVEPDGREWVVIQRRLDGSINFDHNWAEFQAFFGDLAGEFWMGNDILRSLTSTQAWRLRVDLEDWEGAAVWAEYDDFTVTGELYTLSVGSYQGTAGDSLKHHDGLPFTTIDNDNDNKNTGNCADAGGGGGWWYDKCQKANLNGRYYPYGTGGDVKDGIQWRAWKGANYSLKKCCMKIRPVA